MSAWTEPEWLAQAHEWIGEQVAQLGLGAVGVIDQHHIRPWSTVMRVPTESGDVYFKANTSALRHEAAAVTLLAAHRPDCVEQLLDTLVELPSDERRRLDGNVSRIREMCDELAGYGLSETIQHDDFHDGQVFVRDGRYLLLDWADACVSHPFFTLSVTLEGMLAWGLDDVEGSVDIGPFRDAYLESFTRIAGDTELDAACATAMRLGWVCRAVNGCLGVPDLDQTRVRLRMFLDGRS